MSRSNCAIGALTLLVAGTQSAGAAAPAVRPGAGVALAAGGILQAVLGLVAVLALVLAAAWLLKRFSGIRASGSGMLRIVGGAAVGQRERIVVVEVGGTWLLIGVAPGQVRTLHTMPRAEAASVADTPAAADAGFATWLRRMMDKRNHD